LVECPEHGLSLVRRSNAELGAASSTRKQQTIWHIISRMTFVGVIVAIGLTAGAATLQPSSRTVKQNADPTVDVELIFAVDVSHSMTLDELAVQREGYADAIQSNEFVQALRAGPIGKISVTYFEWSSSDDQRIIVPWRLIDGPESAAAVAKDIMKIPVQRGTHTSISGAIRFAMPLFDQDPYTSTRQVIDISGDGPNNNGPPVASIRARALEMGIVINGLPIMMNESSSMMDIQHLDWYYDDCIVGGPGSFTVPINGRDGFKHAILIKLLREVSDRTPQTVSVRKAADRQPRVDCAIREKIFEEH
jgi:hypothetical protein